MQNYIVGVKVESVESEWTYDYPITQSDIDAVQALIIQR